MYNTAESLMFTQ